MSQPFHLAKQYDSSFSKEKTAQKELEYSLTHQK